MGCLSIAVRPGRSRALSHVKSRTGNRECMSPNSTRRTPMAAMNTKSAAGTASTIAPDTIKSAFREIMDDEANHVSFFEAALEKAGAPVRPKPTFKGLALSNQSDFITMAGALENVGVGAFLLAIPAISDKNYMAAAA